MRRTSLARTEGEKAKEREAKTKHILEAHEVGEDRGVGGVGEQEELRAL